MAGATAALFGAEFQALLAAALRRVASLRGRRDSELRARRRVGAPRGAFAGHRPYAPGDEVRLVDWSAYARTGELHAKLFEEDERRALTLLVDCSESMSASARFDAARRYAALIGGLALARLDGLRLVLGPDAVHVFEGSAGLPGLLQRLESAPLRAVEPLALAAVPVDRGWLGSVCWISDFACPEHYGRALAVLRPGRNRQVSGLLPMVASDTKPDADGWLELRDPGDRRPRTRADRCGVACRDGVGARTVRPASRCGVRDREGSAAAPERAATG